MEEQKGKVYWISEDAKPGGDGSFEKPFNNFDDLNKALAPADVIFVLDNSLEIKVNNRDVIVKTGTVKWFDDKKGFGFIEHSEGDIFVHHSGILSTGYRTLKEGQRVSFDVTNSPKGKQATKVAVI